MAKVIRRGMLPPDHPIYKEGWTVSLRGGGPARTSESADSSKPRSNFPYSNPITRLDAFDIAFRHGLFGIPEEGSEQPRAFKWDDIPHREPSVYGLDTKDKEHWWVVYAPWDGLALKSSEIAVVDDRNGELIYMGSAGDEG